MKYQKLKIIFIFIFLILASEAKAGGASLFLSPPSGTYAINSTFSIKVNVNSGGEAINAAEGTLVYNPAELSVVSLSKSSSIFTFWTTEPTFSNSTGNISFGGGMPSNFTGTNGTIFSITFKAKASAATQINFSSGSILAADGKGTNVLATMNGGVYTLKAIIIAPPAEEPPSGEEEEVEYVPLPTPEGTPAAPIVYSLTHPDPEKWYSNNAPEFAWNLPSDVTGVSIYLSKSSVSNPGSLPDGLFSSKSYKDIEDGIWYFHIKARNSFGWGPIAHRKVLIDTENPQLFETIIEIGNALTIKGTSLYPEGAITVFVKKEWEEPVAKDIKTDSQGNWTFVYEKSLDKGTYQVWLEITDSRGAKSYPTEKITIASALPALIKFGEVAVNYLTIIITLIALIVFLIMIIAYSWRRISLWRKKLRKETKEIEENVVKAFKSLHKEVQEQIEYLDKKQGLNKGEKIVRDKLEGALKISEKLISKEIKDVLKELEK